MEQADKETMGTILCIEDQIRTLREAADDFERWGDKGGARRARSEARTLQQLLRSKQR